MYSRIVLYENDATDRSQYEGKTDLTVDFSDLTLSGRLHDWKNSKDPEEDVSSLVLRLPETDFTLNGFSGRFEADELDPGETANFAYEGAFAGPRATAVGTISGTLSQPDVEAPATAIGFFWGRRPANKPKTPPACSSLVCGAFILGVDSG